MVVGTDFERDGGTLHVVVDVVENHPKSIVFWNIFNGVGVYHVTDEARRHISRVHLVNRQNAVEVHVGPLVNFLVDLELEF